MWEKQIPYRNYLLKVTLNNIDEFLKSKGFTKDKRGTLNIYSNKKGIPFESFIFETENMNDEYNLHLFINHLTHVFDYTCEEMYYHLLGDIKIKLDIIEICKTLNDLNKALVIASVFHNNVNDKGGNDYILHPLTVMDNLKLKEEKFRVVAILHDILEDTIITIEDLKEMGFSEEIIVALVCLTRQEGETYKEFINRVATNEISIYVKIADLENNLDISRIPNPTDKDYNRLSKYKKYYGYLQAIRK